MQNTNVIAMVLSLAVAACTHWTAIPHYGRRTEIARRLVGAPQIEQVSSSELDAGFGAVSTSHRRTTFAGGALSEGSESVTRTHCVQQAQIDYVQDIELQPAVEHRELDVAASVMLGVAGAAILGFAKSKYDSDMRTYEMDPGFFSQPSQPSAAYSMGGGMLAGGAVWLLYSLTSLPKGQPPAPHTQQRQWADTTYVEATGCGLVPADR